ncbi:MAG: DUF2029 domain-containing protein [Gemmataceae bacterium]|nr:DUF2029 domain-containing protein [Gemmataceae bacterium]MDW8265610.1 glycosyltransferase family 87 protein [Gemmataceae bacterium]
MDHSSDRPLSRWERWGLVALMTFFVGFGVVTEWRTAFARRPMGDLLVYLRAAWAIRQGIDLYQMTDHNGWHYNYPPLFAILMTPLADPVPGADRHGYLPLAVSAAIWYVLNVLALFLAVHGLASVLEGSAENRPRVGSRRWWALRALPIVFCLPPLAHTLGRGQVNILLLLLIVGMAAAWASGRRFAAGLCLAAAICLKVIPALLLAYPLWRRDGRCLAGCLVGLIVGLGVVPLAVFGPERTVHYYGEFMRCVLLPGTAQGSDQSRAKELIASSASHSQSIGSILHNTLHPDPTTRPEQASSFVRGFHWLAGALMVLATLLAAPQGDDGRGTVLALGALSVVMVLVSPVSHLHYASLALPLVAGLLAERSSGSTGNAWRRWLPFVGFTAALGLPLLPGQVTLRYYGLTMYALLALWGGCMAVLLTRPGGPLPRGLFVESSRQISLIFRLVRQRMMHDA